MEFSRYRFFAFRLTSIWCEFKLSVFLVWLVVFFFVLQYTKCINTLKMQAVTLSWHVSDCNRIMALKDYYL